MSNENYPPQPENNGLPAYNGQPSGPPQYGGQQYGAPQYGGPQYGGPQYGGPQYSGGEPPIGAPWYGIPFTKAFSRFWKKYATFSGRASRSEYWWWFLWSFLITFVLFIVASLISLATGDYSAASRATSTGASASFNGNSPIGSAIIVLWYLAILIPSIAIQVRRLHDANFRGWWVLLNLVFFLGPIALLVMNVLPPRPEGQRFDRQTS